METPSNKHPQFSLAWMLLAMTVLALMLAVGWTSHKAGNDSFTYRRRLLELEYEYAVATAKRETDYQRQLAEVKQAADAKIKAQKQSLSKLRWQAGVPDLSEPDRVSAGGIHHFTAGVHSIHILQPAGRRLVLCYALEGAVDGKLPPALGKVPLMPELDAQSEATIFSLSVRKSDETNLLFQQRHYLQFEGQVPPFRVPLPENHLLEKGFIRSGLIEQSPHPLSGASDVPYLLASFYRDSDTPSYGLILWVEDAPPAAADE